MLCSKMCMVFCFKQKSSCDMLISDWISDVCSSDLIPAVGADEDARAVAEDVAYPAGLFIARAASEGAAHAVDRSAVLALQLLAAEPVHDRDDGAAIRKATVARRIIKGFAVQFDGIGCRGTHGGGSFCRLRFHGLFSYGEIGRAH